MTLIPPTKTDGMADSAAGGKRAWWLILLGFVLVWALIVFRFAPRIGSDVLPVPRLDMPKPTRQADFGWRVVDLEGQRVDFRRFEGKAVFLNFWATWCPPCLEEMPAISQLASNPRLKDVTFLLVSTDEDAEAVRRFVRDHKLRVAVYRVTEPPPDVFMTDGLPATFLISRRGHIVALEEGPAQWDDPKVVDFLELLAREPAKP